MELSVKVVSGNQVSGYLSALAGLRVEVFREFPYLYDGSDEYERQYLQKYGNSDRSVIVLVERGGEVVGASSGLPLIDEAEEMQRPFIEAGYDLNGIFYCGESVLLPAHRWTPAGKNVAINATLN